MVRRASDADHWPNGTSQALGREAGDERGVEVRRVLVRLGKFHAFPSGFLLNAHLLEQFFISARDETAS